MLGCWSLIKYGRNIWQIIPRFQLDRAPPRHFHIGPIKLRNAILGFFRTRVQIDLGHYIHLQNKWYPIKCFSFPQWDVQVFFVAYQILLRRSSILVRWQTLGMTSQFSLLRPQQRAKPGICHLQPVGTIGIIIFVNYTLCWWGTDLLNWKQFLGFSRRAITADGGGGWWRWMIMMKKVMREE